VSNGEFRGDDMKAYVLIHNSKSYFMTKVQRNTLFDCGKIYLCNSLHEDTEKDVMVYHIFDESLTREILREVGGN
jgi:hypothetical protein